MADNNKQWYNTPKSEPGKKPANRPSGKPNGKRPVKANAKNGVPPKKPVPNKPNGNVASKPVNRAPVNKPAGKPASANPIVAADIENRRKQKAKMEKARREKAKADKQKKVEQAMANREKKLEKQKVREQKEYKKKVSSRKNAESKALRNGVFGAVAAALSLLVLAFVIYHLFNYIADKPEFSFVSNGAIEHTIGAKALIVRDETIITSGASGELVTQTTEGSKVFKSQSIAMVVPDDMSATIDNLHNVQSQISEVQQELISEGSVTEADVIYDKYNKNIENVVDMIRADAMKGNISDMSSYASSIVVLLDERESELSEIDFDDERLRVLRADERNYEAQLENASTIVEADHPGIVSFRLDGKEADLNFDSFLDMELSDVKSQINGAGGAISSDLTIEAGEAVARIAGNEAQYFAVYLTNNDAAASDFAVGTEHDINVSSEGISISDCEVVRCDNDNKGMLIVFKTTRYVEDLLDLRSADIEIVINKTSGMRVPMSSLVNRDLASTSSEGFSVYFAPDSGITDAAFVKDAIFNVNIIPDAQPVAEGEEAPELTNITVGSCKVLHSETLENGGVIVGFSTLSDYSQLLKVNSKFDGYQAMFIDTESGLSTSTTHIIPTTYAGVGSIYVNNQGFVEEVRVIVTDYDREFAIVRAIGRSDNPNLETVYITNPTSCEPGDKVG